MGDGGPVEVPVVGDDAVAVAVLLAREAAHEGLAAEGRAPAAVEGGDVALGDLEDGLDAVEGAGDGDVAAAWDLDQLLVPLCEARARLRFGGDFPVRRFHQILH